MLIYIFRHAEAQERAEGQIDEWRCLTENGRKDAIRTASKIPGLGSKPRLTITSPLPRAVQTAELAARYACRKNRVEVSPLLLPGEEAGKVAAYLATLDGSSRVLLVGHEPQLGALAALLLGRSEALSLKKGACLAIKLKDPAKPGEFIGYQVPGRKPVTSLKKAFGGAGA